MTNEQKVFLKNMFIFVFILIGFIVSYSVFKYAYSKVDESLIRARWTNDRVVAQMGVFGYLMYDVESDIVSKFKTVSESDKNLVKSYISNFERNNSQFMKQSTKKNVLLVQMESMDGGLMFQSCNGQEILPNLNKFSEQCIYFENTFDITGTGRTSDAEFATLTSLLPIQNEVVYEKYDLKNIYALPKVLASNGYKTISVHGYKQEFWNRVITHPALGFEKSYFMKDLDESEMLGWGIDDKSVVKQAVDILEEQDDPTFMFVVLLTNHYPYYYAPQSIFPYSDKVEENYINSAHYQDEAIGMLIDELKSRGMLKDTVVVLYGDHDSAITSTVYSLLGLKYDVETYTDDRIPLMMYTGLESKVDSTYRSQTDTAPLILDNLGIEVPKTMLGNGNFYDEEGILKANSNLVYNKNGIPSISASKVKAGTFTKVIINEGLGILED